MVGGKRLEIVVLEIKKDLLYKKAEPNKILLFMEKNKNDDEKKYKVIGSAPYQVIGAVYGRPPNSLEKLVSFYLENKLLENPRKGFYKICRVFIDKKIVSTGELGDIGLYAEADKIKEGAKILLGIQKKEEDD